jgi:hypothetical protein
MKRARLFSRFLAPSPVLALTIVIAAFSAARGADNPPQRYALLIGVNSYTHLSDLQFCENDMRSLREACIAAGFPEKNVTYMHKGSERPELIPVKNHVMEQLKILLKGVQPNDLVLVAFSGHGVHVGDKDYFCTIDAKLEDPQGTMVPAAEVADLLDKSPARQQVMLIDACRNDPLPEGTRSASGPSVATAFTRSVKSKDNASHGLMVMRSCDEQQVSVEDPALQHGVFMNFVVNGLLGHADANRDKQVTLLELYQYAEYETRNHVRVTRSMLQTPSMKGDFAGNYIMADVSERPVKLDLQPVSSTGGASKGPSNLEMKLYDQAYGLFQQGKTTEAITAFEQLVSVAEDEQLKKVVRLKLASAYLAIDPVAHIAKALALHQESGLDTIPMVVQVPTANVMIGQKALVSVKATQMVGISSVDGEWFLAESVDGYPLNPEERGFLHKSTFQRPAPKPQPAAAGKPQQVASSGGYGYGYGNSGGLRSASGGNSSVADYQRELDYYDHPADKAQVQQLRTGLDQLDRMERRGASEMAIRAKERELYRQAEQLERKEATREAIRSFFRGD